MTRLATDIELADLIARLHARFGRDLSSYRLGCLKRRIALRMSTLGLESLEGYFDHLAARPDEIEALLDTVTIHVTEFFRDAEVFEAIAKKLLPGVLARAGRGSSTAVRVWSAGCSTGEEPYSLAIVIEEYLRANRIGLGLEVFATDISKEACRSARRGAYDLHKTERIPPALRARYFERFEGGLRVAESLRRVVHVQQHDLFKDPPFSGLDCVVCRNTLIHFDHAVRSEVLARFHRALGEGGMLVLGKSEAIMGASAPLFSLVDPRNKMYVKSSIAADPKGGNR